MLNTPNLNRQGASGLLNVQNDELRRLQRCEADMDIDDAMTDFGLGGRLSTAFDEIAWRGVAP